MYCEEDYNDLMAKRCKTCDGVIKGKIAKTSIGYFFHPEHFICMKVSYNLFFSNIAKCGTSLLGKKYKISDDQNRVLCSPCKEEEIKYLNADVIVTSSVIDFCRLTSARNVRCLLSENIFSSTPNISIPAITDATNVVLSSREEIVVNSKVICIA